MENPIKMDDLGVPLFLETPSYPPSESNQKACAVSIREQSEDHPRGKGAFTSVIDTYLRVVTAVDV